jgi:hypothetical protein
LCDILGKVVTSDFGTKTEMPPQSLDFRYREQSGRHLLAASISGFDSTETSATTAVGLNANSNECLTAPIPLPSHLGSYWISLLGFIEFEVEAASKLALLANLILRKSLF